MISYIGCKYWLNIANDNGKPCIYCDDYSEFIPKKERGKEMRKLKRGTMVWSKEDGRGIVMGPMRISEVVPVMFEGHSESMVMERKYLFAKGDKVYTTTYKGNQIDNYNKAKFYEPLTHTTDLKSRYTVTDSSGTREHTYVYDVKHCEVHDARQNELREAKIAQAKARVHHGQAQRIGQLELSIESLPCKNIWYQNDTGKYASTSPNYQEISKSEMIHRLNSMTKDAVLDEMANIARHYHIGSGDLRSILRRK
jgi:hypothetical protein